MFFLNLALKFRYQPGCLKILGSRGGAAEYSTLPECHNMFLGE
jgi:hypothetical protein